MKKILFILLFIIGTPCLVFADASGPSIIGYDAVVINKSGVKDPDSGKVIKYNTKIHVYNESDSNAEACNYTGKNECNDDTFSIPLKDILPLKEEILPSELKNKNNQETFLEEVKETILIVGKNGYKLKKGPAGVYGKYSTVIPYNTKITAKYAIKPFMDYYSWYYVDDGTYKGWIENDDAVAEENIKILFFNDTKFLDGTTNKLIETIPKETVINETYINYPNIYFTYKNNFGYVDVENNHVGYEDSGYVIVVKSTELKSKDKSVTGVAKGEIIKSLYVTYDDEYYVEYNGTKGFINKKDIISLGTEKNTKEISFDEELEVYDTDYIKESIIFLDEGETLESYSKKHLTNQTIPANSKITYYKTGTIYQNNSDKHYEMNLISYKNIIGWVIAEEYEGEDYSETSTPTAIPQPGEKETKNNGESQNIIIYCIIGAVVMVALSIIGIIMVNKKKKKNDKKEVKQDIKSNGPIKEENKKEDKKNEEK